MPRQYDATERRLEAALKAVTAGRPSVWPVRVPVKTPLPVIAFERVRSLPQAALGRERARARFAVAVMTKSYFSDRSHVGSVELAARCREAVEASVLRRVAISEYDDDYSEPFGAFVRTFEVEIG